MATNNSTAATVSSDALPDIMVYPNGFVTREVTDQYNSRLSLQAFCNIDNGLVGEEGMKRRIVRYKATDGAEKLGRGEGNTKDISTNYTEVEYEIDLVQNRFKWQDEDFMTDEMAVETGIKHMVTDMFNYHNAKIYAEFLKGTQTVTLAGNDYFSAFVDAAAMFKAEELDSLSLKAFVSANDLKAIRKSAKETLQYVQAFHETGYVGTIAGINLFSKNDAETGNIVISTNKAVTIFQKTGTQVESGRDPDIRQNIMWSRRYSVVALTDDTQVVRIVGGA